MVISRTGSFRRRFAFGALLGILPLLGARADELGDFLARQTRPITINATNAEVGTLLKTIARSGEFDMILSSEANAKVSVRMKDVPIGVALARVLELGGIEAGISDGVLLAYPKDGVRVFRLHYASVTRVQAIVKEFVTGKISIDTKTNTLIVQDSAQVLNRIQKLVAQLDRRPRQVNVEAAIISTKLDDATNLGVNFSKLHVISGDRDDRILARTSGFASVDAGATTSAAQGLFVSFMRMEGGITAVLEALQKTTDFKVLSHPRLEAMSGEPAEIRVGEELGFLTTKVSVGAAAGGAPVTEQSVEFLTVGTSLKFTAQVSEDGTVELDLKPEISTGAIDAKGLPAKTTSQMNTKVKVKSGETLLLGGLIRTREETTTNQVPILGRIPVLGALFRSKSMAKVNDEVIVMITPTLKDDGPSPAGP